MIIKLSSKKINYFQILKQKYLFRLKKMEFKFDLSQITRFEKVTLNQVSKAALPLAVRGTLNTAAFKTRENYQQSMKEEFTLRNTFTERSARFQTAKTLKIMDMESKTGSIAEYMLKQESGARLKSIGKWGVQIPTAQAAGQVGTRTGVVKKKFRHGYLKLANETGIKAKNKKQFILMSIRVAALRSQSPYVFLPLSHPGIYKVTAQGKIPRAFFKTKTGKKKKRNFKWGKPRGTPGQEQLRLLYSLKRKEVKIEKTEMLQKDAQKTAINMQKIFNAEAERQFQKFVRR